MHRVNIKPLSVNEAYIGRKVKTKGLREYQKALMLLLPNSVWIPAGRFEVLYRFGFSSEKSDWDNCIKALQDVMATKYGFNDKMIFRGTVEKEIVPPGREFVEFQIREYKPSFFK